MRTRNITLHSTRDHDHDADIKGLEFQAERTRVGVQRGLGGVVDGTECVGDDTRHGADVDDEALGGEEEGDEALGYGYYAEDVGFETGAGVVEGDVEGGHGAVASSVQLNKISIPFHLLELALGINVGCGRGETNALLTNISNFPPVNASTSFFAASILSVLVTSKLIVEHPKSSRSVMVERFRALAMT